MNLIPDEWQLMFPAIDNVIQSIQHISNARDAELAGIPGLLTEVSTRRECQHLLRLIAERWTNQPAWTHPITSIAGHMVLGRNDEGTILACGTSSLSEPDAPLYTSPTDAMVCPVTQGGVKVETRSLVGNTDFIMADPSMELNRPTVINCEQHTTMTISRGTVFNYLADDAMLLKLEFSKRTPLKFQFHPSTGKFFGAALSSVADSQLVAFINSLRVTGTPEMAQELLPYTEHDSHWIRWETVKTIAALNPDMARERVREMVNDSHPEIRNAALATLQKA